MARQSAIDLASMSLRTMMLIAMLALAACAPVNRAGEEGYVDHNNDGRFNPG
jgi:hypothetical protein